MKIVETKNLSFKYNSEADQNKDYALSKIDIDIKKGEFVVILGKNGSGKSTLAKHLNALLLPTKGDVFVVGINTKDEEKLWDIRKSAGMVFQNPDNQIIASVVEEDVAFGLENIGIESSEIRKAVDASLEYFSMSEYKKQSPAMLSGGQKQRIALAGIFAMKPEIIILDEATAMLDPIGRKEVLQAVMSLQKEENMTIILITHFMEEAVQADRVFLMEDGEIVKSGTAKEIFKEVELLKKLHLDVPQVTELAYILKKNGVDIDDSILSVDEMVGALCQFL